jgi:glycosyltransferase involved in cell wall biosynthesis
MIRSGIVLSDYRPRHAGKGDPGITVGMVACMKPQKAPVDFVRVASRVVRADPRVRFVLVGDGEMRGAVERAIREEGVEGSVSLLGWRRDVPELLRGFDILLHTSLWEGLPRVFPEAMATGLPIVATRVDGAPEAIEEGVTGHMLPPRDVDGMARRVLELAGDPGRRIALGAAARKRVSPWDIDRMVRLQEVLYDRLMRGEPGGSAAPLRTEAAG